jgi:hypothetical protein
LTWTSHPARSRPRDVALVAAVVFLSAWAVMVGLESAFLAGLAAAILVLAVTPFLLPTRYTIDDDGVEAVRAFGRRRRRWADLRRLDVGPGAALVSPFAHRSWLDRQRGLLILFDGADRDAVIRALRARLP